MKRTTIAFVILFALPFCVIAQTAEETTLITLQQKIDDAVVSADLPFLKTVYADDFRFKHSTGHIDNKETWLKDIEKSKGDFISRTHTEVEAEIHGDIGITYGKLTVLRKSKNYYLKYVRVYRNIKGQWQMIMHRSVEELTQ